MQFAAGEHRLEQIARIHRSLAGAGADDGVQFIDEEDHLAFRSGDLLQNSLEPLLEFAPVLGTGDQRAHVEGDDLPVLEVFRNVAAHHTAGESFDDGGLADAGLADQHRVVLGAARQDLDHPPDLVVTADDRVELVLHRHLGEVARILLERLEGALGIRRGDPLVAPDGLERLQHAVGGETGLAQQLRRGRAGGGEHRQKQVFDADVFILHRLGLPGGFHQQRAELPGVVDLLCL